MFYLVLLLLLLQEHKIGEDFLGPEGRGVGRHEGDVPLSAVIAFLGTHAQRLHSTHTTHTTHTQGQEKDKEKTLKML